LLQSGADTAGGLLNASIFVEANNNQGTPNNFSNDTLAMIGLGGGLTGTQAAAKAACDNAYATSKGFNVY
jgi:hypothetical protein